MSKRLTISMVVALCFTLLTADATAQVHVTHVSPNTGVAAALLNVNFRMHPNWPAPSEVARLADPLPIPLVPLPAYAPWLNPIEKRWRWLGQEVLHLHRFSEAWDEFKERVGGFLDQFAGGLYDLLRYVGLLPNQ